MVFYSRNPAENALSDVFALGAWRDVACTPIVSALRDEGFAPRLLKRPEIYPNPSFLPIAEGDGPCLHFCFRTLERANLVKGATNILFWPWRYPVVSERFAPGAGVRENVRHMMRLFDVVCCPSETAARFLREAGVERVAVVPAPIASRETATSLSTIHGFIANYRRHDPQPQPKRRLTEFLDAVRRGRGESPALFVAVIDPDDPCSGVEAALRGFTIASRAGGAATEASAPRRAALAVVLALDPVRRAKIPDQDWLRVMVDRWFEQEADLVTSDILVIARKMSAGETAALFNRADYFLSTASASDQALAMQAAMASGVVPVVARTSALAEGLDDAVSLPIATKPSVAWIGRDAGIDPTASRGEAPAPAGPWPLVDGKRSFDVEAPDVSAVARACIAAMSLSDERRAELAAAAAARAVSTFSSEALGRRLSSLFREIAPDVAKVDAP